jgi:3-oxoacyl-[acyl-carrier protein] reductase
MLLKDKVAIITGSSRGIGQSIARAFSTEGAHIVLNGRKTSSQRLRDLAKEIESKGGKALVVRGDVGKCKTAQCLIQKTIETFGRIDILVNNAGTSPMASIEQISEREWDEVLRINLKSAFLCSKEVLPHMKRQASGVILNISSGSAKSGGVAAHYAASKSGMNTFTKSLAFEGAPYGVRANAISPGPIETEMADDLFTPERKRFLESVIPLRRLGKASEIADAAVFLCSEEANFITGEILELDGGLNFYKPLSYSGRNRNKIRFVAKRNPGSGKRK